ncbi:MAG TPA: DNA-3-methyladenine glycosylase I [Gammaproteobacteria bacterium]|nr:DNA-3-methyladenine glycosylase I [Gammaproteobacteria bacterium]
MSEALKRETPRRCSWAGSDPVYLAYHDEEWGVPCWDDDKLFEMLLLEGAQAGLSWRTILQKREHYRKAFAGFDATKIVRFTARKVDSLLQDPGIVRNRLKVNAFIGNARAYLNIKDDHDSFADYIWNFVDGKPIQNRWKTMSQVPASTARSDAMSKDLKKRGFKFVGTTICYAYMQAVGMVNDHTTDCFRHRQVNVR